MKEKICESFDYINKINDTILNIKPNQLDQAYGKIKESDYIAILASGRSLHTSLIGAEEIVLTSDKMIQTPDDIGFQGHTIYEIAPKIEEKYKNPLLMAVSGSGGTNSVREGLEGLSLYNKENFDTRWNSILFTEKPESDAGKLINSLDGTLVEFKGDKNDSSDYIKSGIMRDRFELENCFVWSTICQMLSQDSEFGEFYKIVEEKLPEIGDSIDKYKDSEFSQELVKSLFSKSDVFSAGRRGGKYVSDNSTVRLAHVKKPINSNAYSFGAPNTPKPGPRDTVIFTSFSGGENIYPGRGGQKDSYVVEWCKDCKKLESEVFSFVGIENSPLEKVSDKTFILKKKNKGKNRWFYNDVTFIQSTVPVLLCKKMKDVGYPLTSELVSWFHSI